MDVGRLSGRAAALARRVPEDVRARLGTAILSGVDSAISTRWDAARRRTESVLVNDLDATSKAISKQFAKEMAVVGAVTGGLAAMPVVGTSAEVAANVAELSMFTMRAGELILTMAALHGYDEASVDDQRAWILAVLTFGNGAAEGLAKLAGELGKGLGGRAARALPTELLQRINRRLGRTIVTKYGTKRGAVAVGQAFPFGIGAVVGGTFNYGSMYAIGRQAHHFFERLPYTPGRRVVPTGPVIDV
jgi:hypothetical protein